MSKIKLKALPENRLGSDSAKTLLARAKREVPDFVKHYAKFEEQMSIGGYSDSTLFNYARAVAKEKKASSTYFKHTVYGLRFFFRLYDLEDRALRLPTIKNDRKLPIALSRDELRRLFKAPQRLNHTVMFSLIYSAGLRVSELCNLKINDVDSDRMLLRVVKSKGNRDR